MSEKVEMKFDNDDVAKAYDNLLVPSLFQPWANQIIKENEPWAGKQVLDLACGTGVVTKALAQNVVPNGKVIALDINSQMLNVARQNCAEYNDTVEYIEASAEDLPLEDNSLNVVVCQQGFQFFPNKATAAAEIYRVLEPNGKAVISTWCPINECEIIGVIYEALEAVNLTEIAQIIRVPFDYVSQQLLEDTFNTAGFSSVKVEKQEKDFCIPGGIDSAISFVYATPIGPKLKELPQEKRDEFHQLFLSKAEQLCNNETTFGKMVTYVMSATK